MAFLFLISPRKVHLFDHRRGDRVEGSASERRDAVLPEVILRSPCDHLLVTSVAPASKCLDDVRMENT
jgi:hypothetical protein